MLKRVKKRLFNLLQQVFYSRHLIYPVEKGEPQKTREPGILLKPKSSFPQTTVEEVAGCLAYEGEAKSIEEMDEAIQANSIK